jgi:FkbM family methyltransferase
MTLVEFHRVLVRDGTPDIGVVKEYPVTYKKMIHHVAGHIFLDIGANIGMFSVNAMLNGATGGVCVEPELDAIAVLEQNMMPYADKVLIFNEAVGVDDGEAILYVPPSGNAVTATTKFNIRGRTEVRVKQIGFQRLVRDTRASLIKTDCEGAELDWLRGDQLPDYVKIVCGELHRERGNEELCQDIIRSFSGWTPIHDPISYSYARCWIVAWKRG